MTAAAAPAEDGEDGDGYCGADGYACYGAWGEEVVEYSRGIDGERGGWGWDCCCHAGSFSGAAFRLCGLLSLFLFPSPYVFSSSITEQEEKTLSRHENYSKLKQKPLCSSDNHHSGVENLNKRFRNMNIHINTKADSRKRKFQLT